jgi:hypothetical protein
MGPTGLVLSCEALNDLTTMVVSSETWNQQ